MFLDNGDKTVNIDDIMETVNHFSSFDYMLEIAAEPLSEEQIKKIHLLLKTNTSDAKKPWFRVGNYKLRPNEVGGIETTLLENVEKEMINLLSNYHKKTKKKVEDIVDFHFEGIHPFQDGNGREWEG